jgi:hypothetical protein
MGKYEIDVGHLDYCKTQQQKEVVSRRVAGASLKQIADDMGLQKSNVGRALKDIYNAAARQGYAPTYDMTRPVPDGFSVRGVSTYYDEDGKPRGQWVKSQADKEKQAELYKAFIGGLCEDIKPIKPKKAPKGAKYSKDVMPCICIGDAHIGMRAFGLETKHHDFDTKIATHQLKEGFHYLTERADPAENSMFVNVGDLIHANTQHGQTYSGTPQDVDSRHHMVMQAAAECMAYGIDLQLQRHKNVTVVMARGNHDTDAAGSLQLMLKFYYRNEPRVNVLDTHGFYHYVEWGKNLIGIHHGDKQKPESLASSMARDMFEAWGRTLFRMWLTGHFHKDAVKTLPGVTHKICAALPPPDSWHASHGYAGDGEMEMLTFRREGGKPHSTVFHVPQPIVQPDARLG